MRERDDNVKYFSQSHDVLPYYQKRIKNVKRKIYDRRKKSNSFQLSR